jgi:hypothetical protein
MVEVYKTEDGLVAGYIEWQRVNKRGEICVDGDFIYIQDLWVHAGFPGLFLIRELSSMILNHPFAQGIFGVYYERMKYDYRNKKWFHINHFKKKAGEHELYKKNLLLSLQ